MLIFSNGMPKSGSTLARNYLFYLMQFCYGADPLSPLKILAERGEIKLVGGFVSGLDDGAMKALLKASGPATPIIAKCHQVLTKEFSDCIDDGAKLVYTYRHPFDLILSSRDHADRTRQSKMPQLQEFVEDAAAIRSVKRSCQVSLEWKNFPGVCLVRYEDLVPEPAATLSKMCSELNLPASKDHIAAAIAQELRVRAPGISQFNTGKTYRFRREMDEDLLASCQAELRAEVLALGYSIE
jgi:hypothetical protein